MTDRKINSNKLVISKFVYLFVFFLFLILMIALIYRTMINYEATPGVTIDDFINNRNIYEETILPKRGTIYDILGNPLAEDVSSYTIIAYLDKERGKDKNNHYRYVHDKEKTAKTLSEHIDTKYERILELLNKEAYQVEFGPGGKNLSQLEMEAIRDLNLDGIDFIKSTKRYYPNGDFASYLLGYTKNKELEDGNTYFVGELGIEGYLNEELTGTSGYITYEKDGRGNQIANSNEYKEDAIPGDDVYLTIDSNIQLFVENEVKSASKESKGEWVVMGVMDAKTGAILGYSSTPSFDPNQRNMVSYLDPLVSYSYEPGSTMKTFSYMCAIESGKYKGTDTFESGSMTYVSALNEKDAVTIKDWNGGKGWGRISYDYGFAMSSNIGVANLLKSVITKNELKACYEKYGFGNKTGITLNNELTGNIDFTYDVEAATAGYGQGINVTPIQMLQGLTILANNGTMLKPYIVSKIVSSTGDIILENKKTELGKVVNSETISKMKELLNSVICNDSNYCTGQAYYMEGYNLIGKTGTASIYENGRYLTGDGEYIYSFAGLYPGDNPEIIVYMAIKKPQDGRNYIADPIKKTIINTSKYLSIEAKKTAAKHLTLNDYTNKTTTIIKKELENNNIKVITLGTGNKIIDQYPTKDITVYEKSVVVLLTNDYDYTMPDLTGLSYKECDSILNLIGKNYKLSGYGYVSEQNIPPGEKINKEIEVTFKNLY